MYQRKRCGCPAAASLALELPEYLVRQGLVEVGRNLELSRTQAEGARLDGRPLNGSDFGHRAIIPNDPERFPCFDPAEEAQRIVLNLLHADVAHAVIVTASVGRTSAPRRARYFAIFSLSTRKRAWLSALVAAVSLGLARRAASYSSTAWPYFLPDMKALPLAMCWP